MQMKPRLMMAALIIRSQTKGFPKDRKCTSCWRAGWFEKSRDVWPVVRDGSGYPHLVEVHGGVSKAQSANASSTAHRLRRWRCLSSWMCVVCVCLCVARLGTRKTTPKRLRVSVQNASVCTEKTRGREEEFSSFSLVPSLFLVLPTFSLQSFSSPFSLSPFSSLSLLFSLSNNDNDHSSSRFSLCTQSSDLPECQSTSTLTHSLLAEHVRTMQETIIKVLVCKARAIWKEVGLCLCWKWVLCLVVVGGVSMCEHALLCSVFVVLSVASVLASMGWLLCGGNG